MRSFHDVIRDLLERLRQSGAAGFLPLTTPVLSLPPVPPAPPPIPAPIPAPPGRSLYRAEPASWGLDGGYDPLSLPSGFETRVFPPPVPAAAQARPKVQVFRLFDELD